MVEPQRGPIWLRITGPEGSKRLTREAVVGTSLLQPDVAAQLGIDSRRAPPLTLELVLDRTANLKSAARR